MSFTTPSSDAASSTAATPATPGGAARGAPALAGPELAALRDRQQATWSAGDYSVVGHTIPLVSELLCEAVDLRAGMRVLDVATGSGNAALAAARRGCAVVGTDYVPALLEKGRVRAAAEGFAIDFREADADRQPCADGAFDAVLSVFGTMFAPSPEAAAAELLRVCKPGGTIGLASWTPESYIGQSFATTARHVAPPRGARSPLEWGTPARIEAWFGGAAATVTATRRTFRFRFRSAAEYVATFRTWYGPTLKAFAALDAAGQAALERDLTALAQHHNASHDATLMLPSEYLEVVIRKR